MTKTVRILKQAVLDIDIIIDDLHKMPVHFDQGSIYQRLITDLDGARITARAIIEIKENTNDNQK